MNIVAKELLENNELAWDSVFSTQEWGKYPSEDLIRFVARHFYKAPDRKAIKILEIGCGPGANVWYLARENFSVYGIDFSKVAITRAKARLDRECQHWQGELTVGDISKLPFEDEFFDAVIDIEAVYCNSFEKSKSIYKEAYRVLKKNGYLYSRTFAVDSWGDKTGENIGYSLWISSEGPLKNKGTSRFSPRDDLKELFVNFEIVDLELITREVNQLNNKIIEWCITCQKK